MREAFTKEQTELLPLPDNPFETNEKQTVIARKTPYIRFDQNDYSIPHHYVQKSLQVVADLHRTTVPGGITFNQQSSSVSLATFAQV